MVDGPPSCSEDQQNLLQEARAKRDMFMKEKARVQNLLNLALEEVKIYQAHLGATESQVVKVEDLIGDIRFRLRERGALINPITSAPPSLTTSEAAPPIPISNVTATPLPLPAPMTATPLPAPDETVLCEPSIE